MDKILIDYEYSPDAFCFTWYARNRDLNIGAFGTTKDEATKIFLSKLKKSEHRQTFSEFVHIDRCAFHNEAYSELWPGQYLCESCLEEHLMTPEEIEPVNSEMDKYLNSIQDSE